MKRYLFVLIYACTMMSPVMLNAQIQAKFEMAKDYYQRLAYSKAIPLFEEYLAKKNDNLEAKIMLADCYRQNNQYIPAEHWYSEVVLDKNLKDPKQILYYAQILQQREKYDMAANWYENYINRVGEEHRAMLQKEACLNAAQLMSTKNNYLITNMPFNTDGYDFGTCLVKDRFLYTSTGGKHTSSKEKNLWTGEGFMDIYEVVVMDSGRQYSAASKWQPTINTKYNEGTLWFDNARGKVYFTRNDYNPDEKEKLTYSSSKEANLNIYEASNNGSAWTNVKALPFNSKEYSCGHPTVSSDGRTMYFASNMPGGKGGVDIWRSILIDSTWQTPVNVEAVNTEGDEMFPYLFKDTKLYFASDGQGGLGGLDIFSVDINDPTSGVKNIGSPFNTSFDDFGFITSDDEYFGYFSSDRPGGKGEDDIYRYVKNDYLLEILVVDKVTQQPIDKASVNVLLDEEMIGQLTTPENGTVTQNVLGGNTYRILGTAVNYLPDSTTKEIVQNELERKLYVKLELLPISMTALVIDAETKKPIENALVAIKSKCLEEPKALTTDTGGLTTPVIIRNDCDYNLQANAKGYLPKIKDIQIRNQAEPYQAVIELEPINEKPIVLNNIYYDFDKWYIRKDAEEDLNLLLQFLKSNPEAKIELSSHTDARASDNYNLVLSQKRADAAVAWLVQHGIDKKMMTAVGYGETKPVNGCVNDVPCTEEQHQMNRRTEFRVLNAGQVTASSAKKDIKVDPCKGCKF